MTITIPNVPDAHTVVTVVHRGSGKVVLFKPKNQPKPNPKSTASPFGFSGVKNTGKDEVSKLTAHRRS